MQNIRRRIRYKKIGKNIIHQGRKPALEAGVENEIADAIKVMFQVGFSPNVTEILEIVAAFIKNRGLIVPTFRDNRPGNDWLQGFLKRTNLSLKKAEMMSVARKSVTSNPFVIYDFYDKLEELYKKYSFKANQIWNCGESGFPIEPQQCSVVATSGAGSENTTTLAVCNAAGETLDPMIVFPGKNMQSTWRGEKALPKTWYGISETGSMTSEVFGSWFEMFSATVKTRPLLLIYDGHLTHVTVDIILRAREENITIMKLPPHTTDLLQPLDVACFGLLKKLWEQKLNAWVSQWGAKEPVKKSHFVNLIGEIWHQGLSSKNIQAGFEKTGIHPLDRSKYPTSRFSKKILQMYVPWVTRGKPDDFMEDFSCWIAATPRKNKQESCTDNNVNYDCFKNKLISPEKNTSTPQRNNNQNGAGEEINTSVLSDADFSILKEENNGQESLCSACTELGATPPTAPAGKKWVRAWALVDNLDQCSSSSLHEAIPERIKVKTDKPPEKRRKIDLHAKVINDDFIEAMIEQTEGTKTKQKKEMKTARKVKEKREEIDENEDDKDSESNEEYHEEDNMNKDNDEDTPKIEKEDKFLNMITLSMYTS